HLAKHFSMGESRRLVFSADMFNIFNLMNLQYAGASTTYCAPIAPATTVAANCGFVGPTNPNFQSLVELTPNSTRFGKLLLNNNPGPPFQMQFSARYQF